MFWILSTCQIEQQQWPCSAVGNNRLRPIQGKMLSEERWFTSQPVSSDSSAWCTHRAAPKCSRLSSHKFLESLSKNGGLSATPTTVRLLATWSKWCYNHACPCPHRPMASPMSLVRVGLATLCITLKTQGKWAWHIFKCMR